MILLIVIMRILTSTIFPIGRAVIPIAQPIFFTAVRMVLAGIILLGYHFCRFGMVPFNLKRTIAPLIIFTITGVYITNVAEFWALQFIPAAKASFFYSLAPFCAALFSYIIFQERMTLKKLYGMAIGLAGFGIMLFNNAPGEQNVASIGFISWGEAALIVAAVSTAYGWIVMRQKILDKMSAVQAIGLSMLGGGLLCFINSFFTEDWSPLPFKTPLNIPGFILTMSIAVICSSVLGYVLYTFLLHTYTATLLSFTSFIEPLSAAFLSWIFLGETITWYFVISALLVFLGLFLFYREELRQGYILKQGE